MANSVNQTGSAFGQPLLHPAWDRFARWALRTKPIFRQFVDVQQVDPTNKSRVVYLPVHKYEEVAEDRSVVDEVVAADQVQATPTDYVRLTIQEHGHAMGRTTLLDDTAYIDIDPVLANKMAKHMVDTVDAMVADQLYSGDQVRNTGNESGDQNVAFSQVLTSNAGDADFDYDPDTDRASITADDALTARITARVVARLRTAAAVPWQGEDYVGIMSPDTAVSFQEDTGVLGWREPHMRVDTQPIYAGVVGRYRGVEWIESPRARVLAGAGSGGLNVQQTLIFGREVAAQFVIREPGPGVSPVLDTYNRHRTIYWYGTLGFTIFRQEPLWRIEHAAS
jgi:N4-gp56 family major capsid protein